MRACSTASAIASGLVLAGLTFAACTSGTAPPQPPPAPESQPPAVDSAAAATTSAASAAKAPEGPKVDPTIGKCREALSASHEDPGDAGVVTNNALSAADAGSSDRFRPLYDLLSSKREGFRCCFEPWGRKNPGMRGKIGLKLEIKSDGTLTSATLDPTRTEVHDPGVEACIVDLAQQLSYPKSPSGKLTTFTYPFDFKPFH